MNFDVELHVVKEELGPLEEPVIGHSEGWLQGRARAKFSSRVPSLMLLLPLVEAGPGEQRLAAAATCLLQGVQTKWTTKIKEPAMASQVHKNQCWGNSAGPFAKFVCWAEVVRDKHKGKWYGRDVQVLIQRMMGKLPTLWTSYEDYPICRSTKVVALVLQI